MRERLDALASGPRNVVPPIEMASDPLPGEFPDISFHTRPQADFIRDINLQSVYFNDLCSQMRLGIVSGKKDTKCDLILNQPPVVIGPSGANATTRPLIANNGTNRDVFQGIFTAMHIDILEPLLRTDLTASERVAQQCYISILLVHETMHAMGIWKRTMAPEYYYHEPFFEDEAIAELGYSWEKAVYIRYRKNQQSFRAT